ncbi:MAG: hypothetical protein ACE5JD_11395 [Candidatus Methylomirabilia bacterium]
MTGPAHFQPVKLTALYRKHLALGAKLGEEGRWRRPEAFTDPEHEAERVRRAVGLADVSPVGKLGLKGQELDKLLEELSGTPLPPASSVCRLRLGQATECLACRLARDECLLLTPPLDLEAVRGALEPRLGSMCVHLTDLTSALAALDLVGPAAPDVLSKLIALDLRPAFFPSLALAQGGLARVHTIVVRLDLGRHLGYRLLIAREHGEFVWDVLLDAGAEFGMIPFGVAAHALLGAESETSSRSTGGRT